MSPSPAPNGPPRMAFGASSALPETVAHTLLPFAAENAADRPLEPLGPGLLAFSCGAFFLSYLGFRFSVHSTIDDVAEMRRWKQVRVAIAFAMVAGNFICAVLAWFSPWFGYAGALATVLLFLLLRSPPESEEWFIREARPHPVAPTLLDQV